MLNYWSTTPWNSMGYWIYRYMCSWRWHLLEVSSMFYTTANLLPGRLGEEKILSISGLELQPLSGSHSILRLISPPQINLIAAIADNSQASVHYSTGWHAPWDHIEKSRFIFAVKIGLSRILACDFIASFHILHETSIILWTGETSQAAKRFK